MKRRGQAKKTNSIVIAKIKFEKKGVGNGRSFLKFLVDFSKKYGYENIGIEQTLTDSGKKFARKYKFRNIYNSENWIISVNQLSKIL